MNIFSSVLISSGRVEMNPRSDEVRVPGKGPLSVPRGEASVISVCRPLVYSGTQWYQGIRAHTCVASGVNPQPGSRKHN